VRASLRASLRARAVRPTAVVASPSLSDAAPQLPRTINWSALDARSMAIAKEVALRVSAGYSHDEIAAAIQAERPIRDLDLPPGVVGRYTISKLLSELRKSMEKANAAEYH
jgi:hypothetical protein